MLQILNPIRTPAKVSAAARYGTSNIPLARRIDRRLISSNDTHLNRFAEKTSEKPCWTGQQCTYTLYCQEAVAALLPLDERDLASRPWFCRLQVDIVQSRRATVCGSECARETVRQYRERPVIPDKGRCNKRLRAISVSRSCPLRLATKRIIRNDGIRFRHANSVIA